MVAMTEPEVSWRPTQTVRGAGDWLKYKPAEMYAGSVTRNPSLAMPANDWYGRSRELAPQLGMCVEASIMRPWLNCGGDGSKAEISTMTSTMFCKLSVFGTEDISFFS